MASCVLALPVASQEARDTARLSDVVISAAATPVDRGQAPATTTVLLGRALRERGITSLADALRTVPGVDVVRSGSFGSTTSLFVRGGERDYVKVLIDGVSVNEPGGSIDAAHLGIADVERIEIVRGPSSVLFGSDAVSGVIHIITNRGQRGLRATAVAQSGSFGSRKGELSVQGGNGGAIYALSGAHRVSSGILPFNNDHRTGSVSGSAGLVGVRAALRLTGHRSAGRYEFPTDGAGVPVDSNQFTREIRNVLGAEGTATLGSLADVRLLISHSSLDRRSANAPDSPGDSADYYYQTDTRSHRRGADLRASVALAREARLTLGAAYERQREVSDGTSTFGTFVLDPTHFNESRDTRAAYGELLAHPIERMQLAIGGRIDDNSRFGAFHTGRLAATASLTSTTVLRASWGSAFKEPAFTEVFPTSFSLGDPALQPERTRTWEAGLDQQLGERLTIGARYFDQRFRDLIQYRFVDRAQDLTTPNYANVAAATARGVEVEAALASLAGLDLSASLTRVRTEVTDEGFGASGTLVVGGPLLRRAEWLGSLSAALRATSRLLVGAESHYTGERTDYDFASSGFVRLDPFTTVSLFADYHLPIRWSAFDLSAMGRVENAFDAGYQSVFG
ncbi:MAG TPA: TonB-dependent receptor, partial [Gemmatimonadaceae bacterium]|nr:TonB-dependent receptor [Gemmatimonadaceae bacterium]